MILWTQWFQSLRMRCLVWIHCCKRPNYDFWVSQDSVATVLKWGGQNYSHSHRFSSWCCVPKIIKIGQCFTELFEKDTVHIRKVRSRRDGRRTAAPWSTCARFHRPVDGSVEPHARNRQSCARCREICPSIHQPATSSHAPFHATATTVQVNMF